ncbi:Aclacinomycin 10-hydroxylase RdmB [Exaiptasia diaphana]|nr:Aclacinomycin 10-hydroxylase RdmB [Exaiptasia diaphana]
MERSTQELAVSSQEGNLLTIMHSVWKNRCIGIIVGLKIPELLCNSEKPSTSIEEIAAKSGCKTSTQLYAVMRLLARWKIGKEVENKHFAKNESMELLRRDKGPSIGHLFEYHSSEEHVSALRSLGSCVKQGKPAFVLDHGMNHVEYMYNLEKCYDQTKMYEGTSEFKIGSDDRRREFADNYSSAVAYYSQLLALPGRTFKNVYEAFPWSTCHKLVDIGGSLGSYLASILKLPGCEHIQGYVLDLPDVVEEARTKIQELGIPEHRIKFVKYDFTKPFPSDLILQADTIMFKNTLSMFVFDHKLVIEILSNCRKLFPSKGGRLLINDCMALEDKDENVGINGFETDAQSIHWLSICGGPLLTKRDWIERIQVLGKDLGYQPVQFYDTFVGGQIGARNPKIKSCVSAD